MLTPREIRRAIESLPLAEREQILDWLGERSCPETPQNWAREPVAVYRAQEPEGPGAPVREALTVEEYFELEERSALRHEYINGAIYAMTGASRAHNLISLGLAAILRQHLREGPCYVFSTDLKLDLKLGEDRIFYYPDVMVACDRQGWGSHFIHNPRLVIEVLSPGTQSTDQREKVLSYKRLPSVEEYAVAAQKECRVTVYRRAARWEPHTYLGYDAVLELRSVGLKLPLDEIYRKALSDA